MFKIVLFIHIISASILFASGIVTAIVLLYSVCQKDIGLIAKNTKRVVISDWSLTLPSGILQLISGIFLAYTMHVLSSWWIIITIILYILSLICWIPVVFQQIKMADIAQNCYLKKEPLTSEFYSLFKKWFILGWPAFIALTIIFWLMVAGPRL